jgi:alpha-L-arabinofuranosidase
MSTATVSVDVSRPLGTIHRNLYGHFIEHLGRCVDEGIWVGEGSAIPNSGGIRTDVTEALKAVGAPIVRWPGGCFADAYDWRDGVGPRAARPVRLNHWWAREEDNQFGTDEFIRFCRMTGAEPYICANVGSGSPREMMQWLEYCNYGGGTTLARERAANGGAAPYEVRYWGIGNENWGCGGALDAAEYAREYRRYAGYLRQVDPTVEFIACGHTHEWNLEFLRQVGQFGITPHLSVHHYYTAGPARGFSEEEYYRLFSAALDFEPRIERDAGLLRFFEPSLGRMRLALDEWGAWHPEARNDNGNYQANTLRDAVCAAMLLDVFNRHCSVISMTNIAQTMNVLQCLIQTAGARMWRTPTYHIYDLYRPHMDATAITAEVECPSVSVMRGDAPHPLPLLSASASARDDAGTVCVTLSNVSLTDEMQVMVNLIGAASVEECSLRVLTAPEADAVNGPDEPDAVAPTAGSFTQHGMSVICVLPAHSTAALTARVG